jgi:nucleoside-diphosphate-sugar epimerase
MKSILFTGFPGFISKHYLNELLKNSEPEEIHFLVLPSMIELAEKEVSIYRSNFSNKKFFIHEGDITKDNLDLDQPPTVQSIHHLAAIYDLAVDPEIAHLINVTGTENVIKFSKAHSEIKQIVLLCFRTWRNSK